MRVCLTSCAAAFYPNPRRRVVREENDNRGLGFPHHLGRSIGLGGRLGADVVRPGRLGVRENGFVVLVFGTCCVCPVAKHPAAANGRRARRPLGSASDHDDGRHRRRRVHHRQCASLARRIPRLAAARGAHCPASVAKAFRWPAYAASVTLLVPRQHLGRANGLVQLGEAAAEIIAPLSAGWLVLRIGLEGVILVDAASFIVGGELCL